MYIVVGSDGLIGSALRKEMQSRNLVGCYTTRSSSTVDGNIFLDLADPSSWKIPDSVSAACITAAHTSLDECRRKSGETKAINVDATLALSARLVERGIFVMLLSTNLVFDGKKPRAAAELETNPQTEYGKQKAALEKAALKLGSEHVAILRLSRVISAEDRLLSGWRSRLESGEAIDAFTDYYLAPVPLSTAVDSILRILERRLSGISQLSANAEISYADFGQYFASCLKKPAELVRRISYKESGLQFEHSPRYPSLDTSRLERELGLAQLTPQAALDVALQIHG